MPRFRPYLAVLKTRSAFLAVAATRKKWVAPALVLQVGPLPKGRWVDQIVIAPEEPTPLYYGITATRKIGGAVQRNRARRRLRALVYDIMALHARRDCAYVLVARSETIVCDAASLRRDLETALKRFRLWQEDALEASLALKASKNMKISGDSGATA